VIKELEQTIKCNERWGNKLEPYYRGVNAAHELTISLLMHPANQTVQQTEENPCTENGCTDIENCDEICQHSQIYSPAWVNEHDKKSEVKFNPCSGVSPEGILCLHCKNHQETCTILETCSVYKALSEAMRE